MSLTSSEVSAGDDATAVQYNNIINDLRYRALLPPRFLVFSSETGGGSSRYNCATFSDDVDYIVESIGSGSTTFEVHDQTAGGDNENRDVTTEWATATSIIGTAKIGVYIYVGMTDASNNTRVYRYAAQDLTSSTQMTVTTLGTTAAPTRMISDGTALYFNNDGGDTASSLHIFEKFTISGTTLTQAGKITCGATTAHFSSASADRKGNLYGYSSSDNKIRRHDSSGTLQATQTLAFITTTGEALDSFHAFDGIPYFYTYQGTTSGIAGYHFAHKVQLLPSNIYS